MRSGDLGMKFLVGIFTPYCVGFVLSREMYSFIFENSDEFFFLLVTLSGILLFLFEKYPGAGVKINKLRIQIEIRFKQ